MVQIIDQRNRAASRKILLAMHADRSLMPMARPKWEGPTVEGSLEMDAFDNEHAIYLVATDPMSGLHLGSVRLLPTTRPHILADIFPMLVEGEVPRAQDIFEITRLCTSPKLADWEAHKAIREQLATALVEYALTAGLRYTMIVHLPHLSELLATGWDVEPLGLPREIDGQMLGAFQVTVKPETLTLFRTRFGIATSVLDLALNA